MNAPERQMLRSSAAAEGESAAGGAARGNAAKEKLQVSKNDDFVLNTKNFEFKTRNCALNTRKCVFKMMYFAGGVPQPGAAAAVSKTDELCIKNEEICIKNEEGVLKMMNFVARQRRTPRFWRTSVTA